jgi:hypothetical protein
MKNGKAPGADGITVEMLKDVQDELLPMLTEMFNRYLETGKIDDNLADSSTLLLFKKGDSTLIRNYRPISLLSVLAKLLTKTMLNRIERTMDWEQGEEQAGFRRDRSTTECMLTLCELIEKSHEYNEPLFLCFIDFEKAFDSVEMNGLWSALQEQGVHCRIIQLFRSIYENAKSEFRVNADERVPVEIKRGVRQGDAASPALFNAALESIFRRLDWDLKGVNINGNYLSHLRFADDIVLVARAREDIQEMLQELDTEATLWGLKINEEKTSWMCSGEQIENFTGSGDFQVTLNERALTRVEKYVYLGRQLSIPQDLKSELARRIRAGWAAFKQHETYLVAKRVPMMHKRRLFDMCVLPAMLYGSETWAATREDLRNLTVAQRRMERRMARTSLRDRRTNEWLRGVTKVRDVVDEAHFRKWSYAWRVAKMDSVRWTRQLVDWRPREAKRSRGRPRRRWRDELAEGSGTSNWTNRARGMELRAWLLQCGRCAL